MKIILCIPGKSFSNRFLLATIQLVKECQEAGIELAVANSSNTVVSFARNGCLGGNALAGRNQKPFGGNVEYDYLLWIDSDIIFDMVAIKKLINAAKKYGGVVSGVYKMSDNRHFSVCKKMDCDYLEKNGSYEFLTAETMPKEPFSAAGIGLGFCMMKYGVVESLQYPWFRHNAIESGPVHDFLSEDLSFCGSVRASGHTITVDPSIRAGHLKPMIL